MNLRWFKAQGRIKGKLLWVLVSLAALLLGGALAAKPAMRWMWGAPHASNLTRIENEPMIEFPLDGRLVDGVPEPWTLKVIRGKEQVSISDSQELSGQKVLHLRAEKSHYLLWYPAKQYDPKQFPIMTWSWKAIVLPTKGDVRTHGAAPLVGDNRNDKAAQIGRASCRERV